MIYSLRGVSGAFFNPAVTLSVVLSSKKDGSLFRLGAYFGAQILGAVSATATFALINTTRQPPDLNSSLGSIVVAESLFTFLVCYVVLTTSLPNPSVDSGTQHNNIAGVAVA